MNWDYYYYNGAILYLAIYFKLERYFINLQINCHNYPERLCFLLIDYVCNISFQISINVPHLELTLP